MITLNNLPASFIPYKKLTICSNSLLNGGFLLSMGEILPLVIGKGEKPQIWLQALVNPEKKRIYFNCRSFNFKTSSCFNYRELRDVNNKYSKY